MSNVFGGRSGFDMDASFVFPQGVLANIPLIGCVVGVGGYKVCIGCEVGLPLCSVPVAPLSRVWSAPQCWSRSPEGQFNQVLLPLSTWPAPKEVIAGASKALAVTEDLCATCVGSHGSAQKQPKVPSIPLLCSSQIYCKTVV